MKHGLTDIRPIIIMKHILLLSTSALLITACAQPNWLADGYKWDDRTPISSAKPTSSWSNMIATADPYRGENPQAIISGVAGDIADSLETRLSRTTPVYLSPIGRPNAMFDHALREKLSDAGYSLSKTPINAYALGYDIKKSKQKDVPDSALDFIIMDIGSKEKRVIETRTQEVPQLK